MWSRSVYTRALQITPGMLNTYYCRLIKNNIIFSSVLPQSFVPLPLHSFPWQIEPGLSPYLSIMLSLHHNMSVSLGALTLNQSITLPLSFSSLNPSFRESCWHFLQTGLTSLALFLSSPLSLSIPPSSHENLLTSIRSERTHSLIFTYTSTDVCRHTGWSKKLKNAVLLLSLMFCWDWVCCLYIWGPGDPSNLCLISKLI